MDEWLQQQQGGRVPEPPFWNIGDLGGVDPFNYHGSSTEEVVTKRRGSSDPYPPSDQFFQQQYEGMFQYSSETPSGATHSSRHARRLYVGGIPPAHTNEEQLKAYLNEVISMCLEEENNDTYILSIYTNHKKCFAFIELKSIELCDACLELDGIVYRGCVLKIQRANEYKPELVASVPRAPLHFNVSRAPFPTNFIRSATSTEPPPYPQPIYQDPVERSTLIRKCSINDITYGSIVILGFPYDEAGRRAGIQSGAASGCSAARHYLRLLLCSSYNAEYGVDLSKLDIADVGDIPPGLHLEDALSRLDDCFTEILRRGGFPIVLGGTEDLSYACVAGLLAVSGGKVGVVSVNSRLNTAVLVCVCIDIYNSYMTEPNPPFTLHLSICSY
jgi:hypothetical protein